MELSNNLKKLLISGVALVTLMASGAGIASTQNSVNASRRTARTARVSKLASRINRLKHRKSNDYKDVKRINRELSRLTAQKNSLTKQRKHHAVKRHVAKRHHARHHAKVNKPSLSQVSNAQTKHKVNKPHESLATWYAHNGKRLYNENINTSNSFRDGVNDGNGSHDGEKADLYVNKAGNKLYHQGWIDGLANTGYDIFNMGTATKSDYANAIHQYQQGLIFAHNNNTNKGIYNGQQWYTPADYD